MDSISCKECKKCLFINTLQLIIQSFTKNKLWKKQISQSSRGLLKCGTVVILPLIIRSERIRVFISSITQISTKRSQNIGLKKIMFQ